MILIAGGREFVAERIVKSDSAIVGYDGDNEVFAFKGITNWSAFELVEGEWDLPDQLKQDVVIVESYESLYAETLQNALAIAELYEMLVGGAE